MTLKHALRKRKARNSKENIYKLHNYIENISYVINELTIFNINRTELNLVLGLCYLMPLSTIFF
jgi:hypothetical protein